MKATKRKNNPKLSLCVMQQGRGGGGGGGWLVLKKKAPKVTLGMNKIFMHFATVILFRFIITVAKDVFYMM
jgi:hypothetical protein